MTMESIGAVPVLIATVVLMAGILIYLIFNYMKLMRRVEEIRKIHQEKDEMIKKIDVRIQQYQTLHQGLREAFTDVLRLIEQKIRAPSANILTYLDIMEKDNERLTAEEIREMTGELRKNIQSLFVLIRDIADRMNQETSNKTENGATRKNDGVETRHS